MNQKKEMFRELKGPYSIIGKNGEYYEVDDISTLYLVFGGTFQSFFTFTMENFLKSRAVKMDDADFACSNHSFILQQLAIHVVDDNKYTPPEYDIVASMATDLLTHMNSTVLSVPDDNNVFIKQHFNHQYFLVKHKYSYNEFSYIPDIVLNVLLKPVALNDFQHFSFWYDQIVFGKTQLIWHWGAKKNRFHQFRSFSTRQEKRWNIAHADEYGEHLVRGRRRKLPDARCDFVRSYQRSWKNNKIRYQWMKNLKNHIDTATIDNNTIENENEEV